MNKSFIAVTFSGKDLQCNTQIGQQYINTDRVNNITDLINDLTTMFSKVCCKRVYADLIKTFGREVNTVNIGGNEFVMSGVINTFLNVCVINCKCGIDYEKKYELFVADYEQLEVEMGDILVKTINDIYHEETLHKIKGICNKIVDIQSNKWYNIDNKRGS